MKRLARLLVAVALLQALDVLSTWAVFQHGAHEANGLSAASLTGGFLTLSLAKVAFVATTVAAAVALHRRGAVDKAARATTVVATFYLLVVGWNVLNIVRATLA